MAQQRDAQRFRKIYGYYRPAPRMEAMAAGGDINDLDWKQSVRAASTGDEPLVGFGGTLDGVSLNDGDRVLLKDQTASAENGIYYFDAVAVALVRTVDGSAGNMDTGAAVYVEEGATNAECAFVLTTPGPITVGTTPLTWIKFAGAGSAIFVSTTSPSLLAKTPYAVSFDTDSRYPNIIGGDVFFFVSGSITGSGANDKKAVFGGDVVVSGSTVIEGDTLEVSGSLIVTGDVLEVSGSLLVLGNLLEFTGSFLVTGSTVLSGSLAQGYNTTAGGLFSHAEGSLTNAASSFSHAEGNSTVANGGGSHAEGDGTVSNGNYSHAEGNTTAANGNYSHAEGYLTVAQGNYSHAEGEQGVSTGIGSHVEGALTYAFGLYAHAEGYDTNALGNSSHAEGNSTFVGLLGMYSSSGMNAGTIDLHTSFGNVTAVFSGSPTVTLCDTTAAGRGGYYSTAIVNSATWDGIKTTLNLSISTTVPGTIWVFDFNGPVATSNIASNYGSGHSEGNSTVVLSPDSHAEGYSTIALGEYSHAEGDSTRAGGYASHAEGYGSYALGTDSHAEGDSTRAYGSYSHAEGSTTIAGGSPFEATISAGVLTFTNTNDISQAFDAFDIVYIIDSVTGIGYETACVSVTPGPPTSVTVDPPLTLAGQVYVMHMNHMFDPMSDETFANCYTQSTHAEGNNTVALGSYSHAEGGGTKALGLSSHAEGFQTKAYGWGSHAEGYGTVASGSFQHVGGKFNAHGNDFSLFVIGDGTDDSTRGDILRVNSGSMIGAGSVQVTGSLYVSGTSTFDPLGRDVANIGADVYFYVSGSSGSMGGIERGVAAFGGDVMITGSLKVGTASIVITQDNIQFGGPTTRIEKLGSDMMFYDANVPTGVTLSSMIGGGGGGGNSTYAQSFVFGDLVVGVLSVNHNLSDQYVSVVVYDDTSTQVMPDSVIATSTTSVDVDLTSFGSFAGTWNLSVLASGSTVGGYTNGFVFGDLSGGVLTVNHNLNNQYVSVVIYDDNDNQVIPDSVVATSPTSAAVDLTSFGSFAGTWNVMVLRTGPSNIGGGGGGPSYFDSTAAVSIYTSGSAAFVGGGDEWGVVTSPSDKGTDVFFYVSGSISGSAAGDKKALFGGDVLISGSLSQGYLTTASGYASHAEGALTTASGQYSHAEGYSTTASGGASHAEGIYTIASGQFSHAEGNSSTSSGNYSHAEGSTTTASGGQSHAEGDSTTAAGDASHAEGQSNTAGCLGYLSDSTSGGVIVLNASYGDVTTEFNPGGYVLMDDSIGSFFYSRGKSFQIASSTFNSPNTEVTLVDATVATSNSHIAVRGSPSPTVADIRMGAYSHAEGSLNFAQTVSAHAEGTNSLASGYASHAEGNNTIASGDSSHAEGYYTTATGGSSHAEGEGTTAAGFASHAEGESTTAHGNYSHAEGHGTIASGSYQHVGGKYNLRDNTFSLFVIGDGIGDPDVDRSDIVRVNPGVAPGLGRFQVTGSVEVSGSYLLNVASGTVGSTYSVSLWDHVVVFTANNVTATLPPTSPVGAHIFFKDGTGNAGTAGGQLLSASIGGLIDGTEGYTMPSVDYTAVTLIKVNDSPETWIVV